MNHTPDPLTGNERTSEYWVQLPGYRIRILHTSRTDMVIPEFTPSRIQADLGDSLMADGYTYIIWSHFEDQIGTEIEDYWCSVVAADGIEKKPEEDPCRSLHMAWQGFVVFAAQRLQSEKIEQDTSARPAKGLKTPGEPSLAERRLHELFHLPYRGWCPLCVKSKGRHGSSTKQIDRQPVIQIDYCFHSTHKDLSLQKILSACAVVVPSKGEREYAKAGLKNSLSSAVGHLAFCNMTKNSH